MRRRSGTARRARRPPGGRGCLRARTAPARGAASASPQRATARRRLRAPSPRARAPRAGPGAPRGRLAARRRGRRSPLPQELEAVSGVAYLPALRLDRVAQPVGLGVVARDPRFPAQPRQLDELGRRLVALGERPEAEEGERAPQQLVVAPAVHHRQRLGCVEVIVERCRKGLPVAAASARATEDVAEALGLRRRLGHRLGGEVDGLAPVAAEEEDEDRLAAPLVERLADRRDVADRLRHLLPGEAEQAVVRPDLRERVAERARLRELVLVVREDEVEPAAVDLEARPEQLFGQRRALDVPAGPAAAPRRVPRGVLTLLVRLPEGEVARVLLERVRFLLLDLVGPLSRQAPVLREARD